MAIGSEISAPHHRIEEEPLPSWRQGIARLDRGVDVQGGRHRFRDRAKDEFTPFFLPADPSLIPTGHDYPLLHAMDCGKCQII